MEHISSADFKKLTPKQQERYWMERGISYNEAVIVDASGNTIRKARARTTSTSTTTGDDLYSGIGAVFGVITFFITWGYCIIAYGFLFGTALGWIPAAILALIATVAWPLIVGLLLLAIMAMFGGW